MIRVNTLADASPEENFLGTLAEEILKARREGIRKLDSVEEVRSKFIPCRTSRERTNS